MAIGGISSVGSSASTKVSSEVSSAKKAETAPQEVQKTQEAAESKNANKVTHVITSGAAESDKEQDEKKQPSDKTLKQVVSDINRKINQNTVAEFGFHEETKRVTIKIVDKESKEVIKEIPPEKTLDLIAKAWELAGILVDEKK